MLKVVENTIRKYNMVNKFSPIIVGVSGGPDSMVLLDILSKLQSSNKLIAVHLNHKFRGVESERDADFVKQECNIRGIEVIIKEIDVPKYMKIVNMGAQEAARKVRYQFYMDTAKEMNTDIIALAHHMDDQAETILMRIIRGTGLYGLSGMSYIRYMNNYKIIRPLLDIKKEQIEEYCRINNIKYINDSSNKLTKYFRNEIRINAIPFLERYNKSLTTHLYQLGKIAQDENKYINSLADEYINNNIVRKNDLLSLNVDKFKNIDIALQRRVIHLILKQYYLKQDISYNNIEDIINLLNQTHPSKSIDLSGIKVYRQYQQLFFSSLQKKEIDKFEYKVSIPSEVTIPEIDSVISVFVHDKYEQQEGMWEVFDYNQLNNQFITVRSREEGDRIELIGMSGSKKLKKLLIDLKIPKEHRAEIPVIESDNLIIWLPGIKRSKHAIPNNLTKKFLYIVTRKV